MSVQLLTLPEAESGLSKLRHYLTHLPTSLPNTSKAYSFETFSWDPEKAEDLGGVDSAINHAFEIIFCPHGRKLGPIVLKEQGPGLTAVVDVLMVHIKNFPRSIILQKWIFDLIDAAKAHGAPDIVEPLVASADVTPSQPEGPLTMKKPKEHLDLCRSASECTLGMYRHFPVCSIEEHLENLQARPDGKCPHDEQESLRQQEVLNQLQKEQRICEQSKLRKRMQRERERAKNAATIHDSLRDSDHAPMSSIAEASRPYRRFNEDNRLDGMGPGRKRIHETVEATRVNWQNPLLWPTIARAADLTGFSMSPIEILRTVKNLNPIQFKALTPQVIGTWIDRTGTRPVWKDSVLRRVVHNPGGQATRKTILSDHPDVVRTIVQHLRNLRIAGIPLDVPRCRGLIIAQLHHAIPEIFERFNNDGTQFRCSETWVRNFLLTNLNWTTRAGTRAAQKLPANIDEVCREQFLRLALTLRECVIDHPQFYVNIDQTNITYQSTNNCTYEEKGSKQVSIVGQEEKRAFTLVVGISAAGDLLPFQVIYQGKSHRSLPAATQRKRAEELGMKFEFSGTDTYWSTFELMCKYVKTILSPYWMHQKELTSVSPDQECVLQLDVWSVHRSIAFRTWLDEKFPWIKYRYVPAGTTGVAQPCDIGIQRPLKQVIRCTQNADVVEETLASLRSGTDPTSIQIDTSIAT